MVLDPALMVLGGAFKEVVGANRVAIACSSCAALKVRCDKGRPCTRCDQTGMAASCVDRVVIDRKALGGADRPKVVACEACYNAKVACSEHRPCRRCSNNAIVCTERIAYTRGRPPTLSTSPRLIKDLPINATVPVPQELKEIFINSVSECNPVNIAQFVWTHDINMFTILNSLSGVLSSADRKEMCRNMMRTAQEVVDQQGTIKPALVHFRQPKVTLLAVRRRYVAHVEAGEPLTTMGFDASVPLLQLVLCTGTDSLEGSIFFNRPAGMLFGYTMHELSNECTRSHQKKATNGRSLCLLFKLFHASSWPVLARCILSMMFLGSCTVRPTCRIPIRIVRRDGRLESFMATIHFVSSNNGLSIQITMFLEDPLPVTPAVVPLLVIPGHEVPGVPQ